MAAVQQNSLLGLPPELRVKIYHHLFLNICIKLQMVVRRRPRKDGLEDETEPLVAGETSIDNGITLVSSLIRAESLPVVRQSLTLYCELQEGGRANLCIKSEYRQLIRWAHFTISTVRPEIPFLDLPSLEGVLFESIEDFEPFVPPKSHHEFRECALSGDVHPYVELVKADVWRCARGTSLHGLLEDAQRGFKITWREQVAMAHINKDGKVFVGISNSISYSSKADMLVARFRLGLFESLRRWFRH